MVKLFNKIHTTKYCVIFAKMVNVCVRKVVFTISLKGRAHVFLHALDFIIGY